MTRRLLATYLVITAFVLIVLVVPLGRTFAAREESAVLAALDRDATVVATLVEDNLEHGEPVGLDPLLIQYGQDPGGRITVVDTRGISVADSAAVGEPPRDFSTRPEIEAALSGDRVSGRRPSETLGGDLLFVARPIGSGGRILGAVRITFPAQALNDSITDNWLRLGLLSLVVLGAVAVVGIALARQVTRPVRSLEATARALADGELNRRVTPVTGAPELEALGRTFNDMAARLETLVASQRAFVANASHQLRTPLTALRLRLENLEDAVTPDARTEVATALEEIRRLSSMVDGLLAIARVEGTDQSPRPVDLAGAIRDRVDMWGPFAAECGVALVSSGPDHAWVRGVPDAIPQILDNLISNALDATPEGGEVAISAQRTGTDWEIHVTDTGSGMTESARQQAFERFFSHGKPGGGSGLGLAIVRELAVASGGHARLEEAPEGGVDAIVRLAGASPR